MSIKKNVFLLSFVLFAIPFVAVSQDQTISKKIDHAFEPLVKFMEDIFFWDPFKAFGFDLGAPVPIVVLWLVLGGLFFTFFLRFINIRAFGHSFAMLRGKYDNPESKGEVNHFQALATALSATVGLGNIAGVAIAISVGGPGATFWMIVAGFFGMSLKFAECTLGHKYREIDEDGVVSGGPMYYLHKGLKAKNLGFLGKFLAVFYTLMIIGASVGGSNMLQSNQAFAQLTTVFPSLAPYGFWFGVLLVLIIAVVIFGGIKSIARVTSRIVPFMSILYFFAALLIILFNINHIAEVFSLIFHGAFSPDAMKGGFIGVLITGFQRGVFSNEAGAGSASIAHAAARTKNPAGEGIVAMLEPFIDTMVICTMTSLVLIFTGTYINPDGLEGAQMTSRAFETVFPWFPYILVVTIILFAFSTMVSWSYYGMKGFNFLFGGPLHALTGTKKLAPVLYYSLFFVCTVVGASSSLEHVISFSDMMLLSLTFPNIIGLVIMAPEIRKESKEYMQKLKSGVIRKFT